VKRGNYCQRFCAKRRKGIESTSAHSLPKDEDSNNDEESTKALLSF
jgi:hypothetical protein